MHGLNVFPFPPPILQSLTLKNKQKKKVGQKMPGWMNLPWSCLFKAKKKLLIENTSPESHCTSGTEPSQLFTGSEMRSHTQKGISSVLLCKDIKKNFFQCENLQLELCTRLKPKQAQMLPTPNPIIMDTPPVVPAVEQLPVQVPALPVHSRPPAVCSTQPRQHCSPADLQLQLQLWQLLHLERLQPLHPVELKKKKPSILCSGCTQSQTLGSFHSGPYILIFRYDSAV